MGIGETQNQDHDLLIQLHTRFEGLEKYTQTALNEISSKLSIFLTNLDKKVDKSEFDQWSKTVEKLDCDFHTLDKKVEVYKATQEGKNQVVITVGNLGWKFWGVLLGVLTLILAIAGTIISAFKQ